MDGGTVRGESRSRGHRERSAPSRAGRRLELALLVCAQSFAVCNGPADDGSGYTSHLYGAGVSRGQAVELGPEGAQPDLVGWRGWGRPGDGQPSALYDRSDPATVEPARAEGRQRQRIPRA